MANRCEAHKPGGGATSVDGSGAPAARADPFRHGLPACSAAARVRLLSGPTRAKSHRPVATRAGLGLDGFFGWLGQSGAILRNATT
jgi:hypothetical protein